MTWAWTISAAAVLAASLILYAAVRRRATAAQRHLILATAFTAVLALPAGMALMPAPPLAIRSVKTTVVMWVNGNDGPGAPLLRASPPVRASAATMLTAIWACGAALLTLRLAVGLWRRRASRMVPAPWAERLLNTDSRIRVMECADSEAPETLGFFRPVLILPVAAREWSEERVRVVLAHELVHVQRHDWLVGLVAHAATILHWFNPLAWRCLQLLRQERELACDDEVLRRGVVGHADYAGHLVEIAASVEAGAVAMAQRSGLETRVRSILDAGVRREGVNMKGKVFAAALAAAVVILLSGLQAPAQGNAALYGTVQDASQAYVPGAVVLVQNVLDKSKREITRTDDAGAFKFSALPPGKYQLEVTRPGFQLYRHDVIDLTAGSAQQLQVMLQLGRVAEMMSVVGTRTPQQAADQAANADGPKRIRIGGNVQATKVVKQVRPSYPANLKEQGVEGTVLLDAVIGRDGRLLNLKSVNTLVHPDLVAAAMEAVQQWEYAPTLLNGEPVEVITTIQINFTLQK